MNNINIEKKNFLQNKKEYTIQLSIKLFKNSHSIRCQGRHQLQGAGRLEKLDLHNLYLIVYKF